MLCLFFFLMDTATTEIYTDLPTLALHDALPIFPSDREGEIGAETGSRGRRHLQGHGRIGSRQPAGRAGREIAETQFTDDTRRDQRARGEVVGAGDQEGVAILLGTRRGRARGERDGVVSGQSGEGEAEIRPRLLAAGFGPSATGPAVRTADDIPGRGRGPVGGCRVGGRSVAGRSVGGRRIAGIHIGWRSVDGRLVQRPDRKSTRLNSSHYC